jgi:hypothetical protein
MSSSSSSSYPDQYWYTGAQGFRDASDLILYKKRQALYQVKGEPVTPDITQSLQNRLSYQFAYIGCTGGVGSTGGGFPSNIRLF